MSRVPAMVITQCAVRKHLPGPIIPKRNSGKVPSPMLARVQAQLENAPP